jgi:hypothetical protein
LIVVVVAVNRAIHCGTATVSVMDTIRRLKGGKTSSFLSTDDIVKEDTIKQLCGELDNFESKFKKTCKSSKAYLSAAEGMGELLHDHTHSITLTPSHSLQSHSLQSHSLQSHSLQSHSLQSHSITHPHAHIDHIVVSDIGGVT